MMLNTTYVPDLAGCFALIYQSKEMFYPDCFTKNICLHKDVIHIYRTLKDTRKCSFNSASIKEIKLINQVLYIHS